MQPTLQLGRFTVSSYTALLDVGLLVALGVLACRARSRVARPDRWLDASLVALVAAVAGGRAGYALMHLAYFRQHPGEIAQFWLGGLSWLGALAGALLSLAIVCRLFSLRFWRLADELALVAPVVGASAWLGCLASGCAYGRAGTGPGWLQADLPDIYGVWALRPNVQLLGAAWSLLLVPLLYFARQSRPTGAVTGLFLTLYGAGMALLSTLRGDSGPLWAGWWLDVALNGMVAVAGAAVLGLLALRSRHS